LQTPFAKGAAFVTPIHNSKVILNVKIFFMILVFKINELLLVDAINNHNVTADIDFHRKDK
jgi:hypothetical protein